MGDGADGSLGTDPVPEKLGGSGRSSFAADVFGQAVRELGLPDIARDSRTIELFDGTVFNLDDPIQYLHNVKIKRNLRIEEILIEQIGSQCSIKLVA